MSAPTKAYVVCSYRHGQQQADEFDDLDCARRHMKLNAPADLYRGAQVRTIVDGMAYVNQHSSPIEKVTQ